MECCFWHLDMIVEVCAFDVEWALKAASSGANRIELCANYPQGGTTPSYGTVKKVCEDIHVPVHVMIRPRAGDFFYTPAEIQVMLEDIQMAKSCGAAGVVLGVLDGDAGVDKCATSELVKVAKPMNVTFHRAFDATKDHIQSLEDIIECGIDRVLTSGQQEKAIKGTKLIAQLVKVAAGRITVIAGSGVNSKNVGQLIEETGVCEVHLSGHTTLPPRMRFVRQELAISGGGDEECVIHTTDGQEIQRVCIEVSKACYKKGPDNA